MQIYQYLYCALLISLISFIKLILNILSLSLLFFLLSCVCFACYLGCYFVYITHKIRANGIKQGH